MKFGKRYSKLTVFMAMLHGVLIGMAAVAVIGLVLFATKGKENPNASVADVPTSGPAPVETPITTAEKPLQLFAKQHGAFSTAESAALFITEDPALAKAEVIQVNDQYYVWSAVGLAEQDIVIGESEETYRKAFTVNTAACGAIGAGKLRQVLTETEMAEIKKLADDQKVEKEGEDTKEFAKSIAVITAFTTDLQVVRLKLLSHYSHTNSCLKFAF